MNRVNEIPKASWHTDRDAMAPIKRTGTDAQGKPSGYVGIFDSWVQWCDYCDQEPPSLPDGAPAGSRKDDRDRGYGDGEEWSGGSWESAIKLARAGWHEQIATTDHIAGDIAYSVIGDRLSTDWRFDRDVAGDMVDVASFLSGEPENMVFAYPEEDTSSGTVVRLVVPVAFTWMVETSLAIKRGNAIVALVDVLTKAGYSLEIWAQLAITGGFPESRVSYAVNVQKATDPLDMGTILYALAHPTMLRRLGFSAMERLPMTMKRKLHVGSGYGSPDSVRPGDVPEVDGPTIILPQLSYNDDWDPSDAEEWIGIALDSLSE